MDMIEKILRLAADSEHMGAWDDGLSQMIGNTAARYVGKELNDDDLDMAAGGVGQDQTPEDV